MKLLIVDDELLIRQGIKQLLSKTNIGLDQIVTATSAEEAITIFHEFKPELVLSDIRMPKMSGLDLIKYLKDTNIPFKSIIISSYDDFEYAKEGILLGIENYLIKPINQIELIQSITSTIEKIKNERQHKQLWTANEREIFKDNFLRRVLQNDVLDSDYQYWEELLIPFDDWKNITVVNFNFNKAFSLEAKKEFRYSLQKKFKYAEFINLSSTELIMIIDKNGLTDSQVKMKIQQIISLPDTFVTIGSSIPNVQLLHKSYEFSKRLQAYSLIFGLGQIISQQDINKDYSFKVKVIAQEELASLIHEFRIEEIEKKLFGLEKNMTESHLDPTEIQNISIKIGLMLYRISFESGIADNDEVSQLRYLMSSITQQKTTKNIISFLITIANQLITRLKKLQTNYSPIIQRILKIIERDLATHHSLKTLADELNMNSAYLGQLFQKEVGLNFNQYCHHLRMKCANEQIVQSTNKISDIAQSLGYEDVSYFYRLYKKDFGVTPNKVRANHLLYKNNKS